MAISHLSSHGQEVMIHALCVLSSVLLGLFWIPIGVWSKLDQIKEYWLECVPGPGIASPSNRDLLLLFVFLGCIRFPLWGCQLFG